MKPARETTIGLGGERSEACLTGRAPDLAEN